jgi:hypothetical protein
MNHLPALDFRSLKSRAAAKTAIATEEPSPSQNQPVTPTRMKPELSSNFRRSRFIKKALTSPETRPSRVDNSRRSFHALSPTNTSANMSSGISQSPVLPSRARSIPLAVSLVAPQLTWIQGRKKHIRTINAAAIETCLLSTTQLRVGPHPGCVL